MKPIQRSVKRRHNPIESSDEDEPQKKRSPKNKDLDLSEESSSDSDIETYLKAPSKLDLDSSFFNTVKTVEAEEKVEDRSNLIGQLSDSESSVEQDRDIYDGTPKNYAHSNDDIPCSSSMNNFEHINAYNAKFEEAKRFIEMYKARKADEEPESMGVDDILEKEEKAFYNSLGSSGFETLSDEENKSDWEEVQVDDDKPLIRKDVQITIDIPGAVKKKKSLDLMAAIKRRINRVKKENQVFVHKVHLLCWIAHGHYINTTLNNQNLLAMALSLLPSKHCYPSGRIDINYLENIVQWYKKMMTNENSITELNSSLEKLLEEQMLKKKVHNYKMYIYIFICILRSLSIKCRLILSLQIEPLRPPQSELCSVSNKNKEEPEKSENMATTTQPEKSKKKSTKQVSFKINNIKTLDKSLNKSIKESQKRKQKHSSINSKEKNTKNKKSSEKVSTTVKDSNSGSNSIIKEIKSKSQKGTLGDKLKKASTNEKTTETLTNKKETIFKQIKNTNKKNKQQPLTVTKLNDIVKTTKESPKLAKRLRSSDKLQKDSSATVSNTRSEDNTNQISVTEKRQLPAKEDKGKAISINIQGAIQNDNINVNNKKLSRRRASRSPIGSEEIEKKNEENQTKRTRQKRSSINKKEIDDVKTNGAENEDIEKNKVVRRSKAPTITENNQREVEKIGGVNINLSKREENINSITLVNQNVNETNSDINVHEDQNTVLVNNMIEKNCNSNKNFHEETNQEDNGLKVSLERESKSPTTECIEENIIDEEDEKSKSDGQPENRTNSQKAIHSKIENCKQKEIIENESLVTEEVIPIKMRLRRSSKSPTIINEEYKHQNDVHMEEKEKITNNSLEAEDAVPIKMRLRRTSKSPTTIDEECNRQNDVHMEEEETIKNNSLETEAVVPIKMRLRRSSKSPTIISECQNEVHMEDTDEVISKQKKGKVGLKIKMPLQRRLSSTSIHPMGEDNEIQEDDEIYEVPRKQFVLPTIKQELLTPKQNSPDSDNGFLGFSTEEMKTTIIPQLDGGADTPVIKKSKKSKPNLTKLKTSPVDKCPRNHPPRLKNLSNYKDVDSEDDFAPHSSSMSKTSPLKRIHSKSSTSSQDNEKSRFFGGATALKSKQLDVRNDIINLVKGNLAQEKATYRKKLVKRKSSHRNLSENDSDYFPEKVPRKTSESDDIFKAKNTLKVKRRIPMKKDLIDIEKKKLEAKEEVKKSKGINVWVEVFAEAEEKWISVDVIEGQVHCVKEIYARATHPVSYILGFENDYYVKDITKRYCENWNTVTRKLRVDNMWWSKTLAPYRAPKSAREKEEDDDLARQQLDQPLPKTISEYKNHPLYALKRHLLKFEGIYPPDALTLGFVRNEPVYSRDCVYTLHSRDIWLKHAKVVKLGEQPYKIVKARPKYDKLSNTVISDQMLEIFGKWQVEDYVPPTAENGIVPKNAYGNVDLFKPCMLPKRTVHLQFPALNKVARKLNIDCPPAVTGFDFHSGFSHPVFDGFVVCEEFSEQLVAAWVQDQEESARKEKEKNEKRIYDNWKKLIKGLLIRERLKRRYDFGTLSNTKDDACENTKKVVKKKHS